MNTNSYALTNMILLPETRFPAGIDYAITVEGKRITAVGLVQDLPESMPTVDLQGQILTPGFIDLQLNGCGGVLFNTDITINTLDVMHQANLKSGCTTFLPTLITASDEDIKQAVGVVRKYRAMHPERVPGIHLEGPYLNPNRRGIHPEEQVRTPDQPMIDWLCEQADVISKITLAPEMCPKGVIRQLCDAGIVISVGHTLATCEQVKAAEEEGATFATHLHNAMTPLTSREPGAVGAVFDSQTMYAGIIADGFHLSWENLRIAQRLLQERLVLVTDATPPVGLDSAEGSTFDFCGQTVHYSQGKCSNADGTLGGSALSMVEAVQNSIAQGIARDTAIDMATRNAACAMGIEQDYGQIAVGQFANFVVLNGDLNWKATISGGVHGNI
ncbi:N-acetylglucosamine-6-phosphate deacetylase [Sansalvadorimonas verongulae]|uniref:N-acetylglucosamine-6-phosphate deacetylase n=1 Tax=Sansalvadorimonas verongulae TaxID=2172824 RepID=UPI0012BBCAD0|nr:N-acetylglucosamine-6-phosphate deacetylase [Sansalvadorimonas verongulae]MTI11995.1 N-acetylglucosamine-6-phosphate deacetylase [Sansalvadorimonas verongulae]